MPVFVCVRVKLPCWKLAVAVAVAAAAFSWQRESVRRFSFCRVIVRVQFQLCRVTVSLAKRMREAHTIVVVNMFRLVVIAVDP